VRLRPRPLLLGLAGIGGLALLLAPPLGSGLWELGRLLAAGDRAAVRDHLRGFGPWAPLVSFGLMQIQAIVAPLPSFPIVYANGLLFGTIWGGLLSWGSGLVSAALCFGLARGVGRPLVERVASAVALGRADALLVRHGVLAVFLGRLIPLTAFDLLSYAAGLTRIRLVPFTVATALGMAPATFLMAAAGDLGTRSLREAIIGMLAVAALAGVALLLAPWCRRRLAPQPVRGRPGPD